MVPDPSCQNERPRILVVEDEAIARTVLTVQLNRLGFRVSEAASATQALSLLERQRFALAFIDLQIPGLSGAALLQRSQRSSAINRGMKAVAISSRIDIDQERQLRQAGFVAWLCKPITLEQLQQVVQAWLTDGQAPTEDQNGKARKDSHFGQIQGDSRARFLASLPQQLAMIESALRHRQRRQVLETVHKLHGAAGFCQFEELRQWAARLETALRQEDNEAYRTIWRRLKREAEALLAQGRI